MSLPRVTIAAPVRNRAWILPRYLDALLALEYPPGLLDFHFIVNDCQDNTEQLLVDWSKRHPLFGFRLDVVNFGRTEDEYDGGTRNAGIRAKSYTVLAQLRQKLFRECPPGNYLLAVDTDILVHTETLLRLLAASKDVIAAVVCNGTGRCYNYLMYHPERDHFFRDYSEPPARYFQVGLTGACCLYSPRAVQLGEWFACATGEDEGLARSLGSHGITQWMEGTLWCEHVMEGPKKNASLPA